TRKEGRTCQHEIISNKVTASSHTDAEKSWREAPEDMQMHSYRARRRAATHRPFNEVINDGAENGHSPIPSIAARLQHAHGFARSQTLCALQKRTKHSDHVRKRWGPTTGALETIEVVHSEVEKACFLSQSKSRPQSPQMV